MAGCSVIPLQPFLKGPTDSSRAGLLLKMIGKPRRSVRGLIASRNDLGSEPATMVGTKVKKCGAKRMTWSHQTVYQALVARDEREKESDTNKYVTLYQPQPLGYNCALLYRPDSKSYAKAPVHLHAWSIPPRKHDHHREFWRDDVFLKIRRTIEFVRCDKPNQPDQAFCQYQVTDWDGFAAALGLHAHRATP